MQGFYEEINRLRRTKKLAIQKQCCKSIDINNGMYFILIETKLNATFY